MKKYFTLLLVAILFAAGFAACYHDQNAANTTLNQATSNLSTVENTTASSSTTAISATTKTTTPVSTAQNLKKEQSPINDDGTGMFSLGMAIDEFETIAKQNGWEVEFAGYSKRLAIVSHDINRPESEEYEFDETGKLLKISTIDKNLTTSKGLSVGDSEARVKELYGEPDEYEEGAPNMMAGFHFFTYYTNEKVKIDVEVGSDPKCVVSWSLSLR
jgi:hypothetical protein